MNRPYCKGLLAGLVLAASLTLHLDAHAAADLDISTPTAVQLRASLHQHFLFLRKYFVSGAVGVTADGLLAVRDAGGIPLSERGKVISEVKADNQERLALYSEIARANNMADMVQKIRETFGNKWIDKEPAGWYYQDASGAWHRK